MKNKYVNVFLFISVMLITVSALSQNKIKGQVLDQETNETLPGANINIKGKNIGTTTDIDGNFELTSTQAFPWTIQVSFLGYVTKEVEITQNTVDLRIILIPDVNQLETIIVTANKKSQSSQKVPMSITALSPAALKKSGSQDFRDYANGIPNLSFAPQGGNTSGRAGTNIAIRGVTGQNTTAMYLDETPLPENIDIRLLDISRVEVLKGPQGTLYGSRNMGGAVKTITNAPNTTKNSGSISMSTATVNEGDADYSLQGMGNIVLGKKLALRVAGFYDFQSGVYDRVFTQTANIRNLTERPEFAPLNETVENVDDIENFGAHISLGFFPSDKVSFIPKIMIQNTSGDGYDFAEVDVDNFTQVRASNVPEGFSDDWTFYSLISKFEMDNGTIVSSTSYLDRKIREQEDTGEATSALYGYDNETIFDFYAGIMNRNIDDTQFNQEIRFESNFEGKFEFILGGFYIDATSENRWNSFLENLATDFGEPEDYDTYIFNGTYKNKEFALFTELYYNITPKLKATLGLRYFDANTSAVTFEDGFNAGGRTDVNGDISESGVIPKFNLTYDISNNKLLYFNVAKGYRLGNVNDVVNTLFNSPSDDAILAALPGGVPPETYESDFLWNYEVGFKGIWNEGKFITNVALFYNDWQNLQQAQTLDSGYSFFSNVGSATSKGVEVDIRAKLSRAFEISGGIGLLDAKIDESGPNLTAQPGDKIQFTPNTTANLSLDYEKSLNENKLLYANLTFQHVGERLNTFEPEIATNRRFIYDAYSIVNSRIGLEYKNYDFALFARNLTNQQANFGSPRAFSGEVPGRPRFSTNRPLTIGLQVSVSF